jgi:hypothetical protein
MKSVSTRNRFWNRKWTCAFESEKFIVKSKKSVVETLLSFNNTFFLGKNVYQEPTFNIFTFICKKNCLMNLYTILFTLVFTIHQPTSKTTFFNSLAAEKIDISGHWEGTITRDEGGGKRTTYAMDLDISQKGKVISGVSYVHYDDGSKIYHAKMEVGGKITGSYIKYLETKLLRADSIPNAVWCVKKADLIHRVKDASPTLEGIWEGATNIGNCVPGRIFLQKKPPRV